MNRLPACLALAAAFVSSTGFAWAQDDVAAGQKQFLTSCGTCHIVDPNGGKRQGPNLAGVFGRKAGTLPGYDYSPALAKAGFVWNEDNLDKWITNAQTFVPGARMPYHQADPAKRKLVITYLKSLSPSK